MNKRATTFEELEKAFFELVQKHNLLAEQFHELKRNTMPIVREHTRYGLAQQ